MPVCYAYLGRKTGVAVCLQDGMPGMLLLICECPFGLHAETKQTILEHASMYFAREKLAQASCSSENLCWCRSLVKTDAYSERDKHTHNARTCCNPDNTEGYASMGCKLWPMTKSMPVQYRCFVCHAYVGTHTSGKKATHARKHICALPAFVQTSSM